MRRRLLPTLAVASAACCVLLCGLWWCSWWQIVGVNYVRADATSLASVACADGLTIWTWRGGRSGGYGHKGLRVWSDGPDDFRRGHAPNFLAATIGFTASQGHIGQSQAVLVMVPLWFPILLAAVPPAGLVGTAEEEGGGEGV